MHDWSSGPRQTAVLQKKAPCPPQPWTERLERPSTTLGHSPPRTDASRKNSKYRALLGVATRLAPRAKTSDPLQLSSEQNNCPPLSQDDRSVWPSSMLGDSQHEPRDVRKKSQSGATFGVAHATGPSGHGESTGYRQPQNPPSP